MKKNIILASDIHLCHCDWLGVPAEQRVGRFIEDIKNEYNRQPFEALLLLGDYSLDHWKWQIKGSYIEQGKSYTKIFVDEYLSQLKRLPIEIRMIAGNHEQYGEALWHELTGYHREDIYVTGDWLFILMDTYKANLDPAEHSDGTYTGADMTFIKKAMEKYPDKKVIICSHYVEPWRDTEEFIDLLRNDNRVICLFGGHIHRSEIWGMEEYGAKPLFSCGQYADPGVTPKTKSMWGYRRLTLTDEYIESCYVTPENEIFCDGEYILHPYGEQDYMKIYLQEK